jgi:lysozyme family protein
MSAFAELDKILKVEGGYTNDPDDAGGETNFGITEAVARANGYTGPMKNMKVEQAREIYKSEYITGPRFDRVYALSPQIASELIDTGVNMGQSVAAKMLQRCLNVFNDKGKLYPDLEVDGKIGPGTCKALEAYLAKRKFEGEVVMLRALNALQGARYIEITENREPNETFVYGWFKNRVVI